MAHRTPSLRTFLAPLLLSAAAGALIGNRAFAQTAAVPVMMEAQPLRQALDALASRSGLQLQVDPALLEGKRSAPVDATLPAEEAFNRVLGNTGLQAVV